MASAGNKSSKRPSMQPEAWTCKDDTLMFARGPNAQVGCRGTASQSEAEAASTVSKKRALSGQATGREGVEACSARAAMEDGSTSRQQNKER
jgi:hypothetical protein